MRLAENLERDGKLLSALEVYEKLLSFRPNSEKVVFEVANLHIRIAEGRRSSSPVHSEALAVSIEKAILTLERLRKMNKNNQYPDEAIRTIIKAFQIIVNKAQTIDDCIIPLVVELSALDQTLTWPELHILFVKTLSRAKNFLAFRDNLEWQRCVKDHLDELRQGAALATLPALGSKTGLDEFLELSLWIHMRVARLTVDDAHSTVDQCKKAIQDLDDAVENSDQFMPEQKTPAMQYWSIMRQEYVAQSKLAKALFQIRLLQRASATQVKTDTVRRRSGTSSHPLEEVDLLQGFVQNVFMQLRICASHRNPQPASPSLHNPTCDRLSLVTHNLLTLLTCFNPRWLMPDTELEQVTFGKSLSTGEVRRERTRRASGPFRDAPKLSSSPPGKPTGGTAALTQGDVTSLHAGTENEKKYPLPFSLPSLSKECDRLLSTSDLPGDIRDVVGWVAKSELTVVNVQSMIKNPWDLGRILDLATYHLNAGTLKMCLRTIFKHLPDSPPQSTASIAAATTSPFSTSFSSANQASSSASADASPRRRSTHHPRPELTVSDLEAFILILLVFRHARLCCPPTSAGGAAAAARTHGQMMYLSLIGRGTGADAGGGWTVSKRQKQFWRSCIILYGETYPQTPYYYRNLLSDSDVNLAIHEIRGTLPPTNTTTSSTRNDRRRRRQILYGLLGTHYTSEMVLGRNGQDRAAQALHYLEMYERWGTKHDEQVEESKGQRENVNGDDDSSPHVLFPHDDPATLALDSLATNLDQKVTQCLQSLEQYTPTRWWLTRFSPSKSTSAAEGDTSVGSVLGGYASSRGTPGTAGTASMLREMATVSPPKLRTQTREGTSGAKSPAWDDLAHEEVEEPYLFEGVSELMVGEESFEQVASWSEHEDNPFFAPEGKNIGATSTPVKKSASQTEGRLAELVATAKAKSPAKGTHPKAEHQSPVPDDEDVLSSTAGDFEHVDMSLSPGSDSPGVGVPDAVVVGKTREQSVPATLSWVAKLRNSSKFGVKPMDLEEDDEDVVMDVDSVHSSPAVSERQQNYVEHDQHEHSPKRPPKMNLSELSHTETSSLSPTSLASPTSLTSPAKRPLKIRSPLSPLDDAPPTQPLMTLVGATESEEARGDDMNSVGEGEMGTRSNSGSARKRVGVRIGFGFGGKGAALGGSGKKSKDFGNMKPRFNRHLAKLDQIRAGVDDADLTLAFTSSIGGASPGPAAAAATPTSTTEDLPLTILAHSLRGWPTPPGVNLGEMGDSDSEADRSLDVGALEPNEVHVQTMDDGEEGPLTMDELGSVPGGVKPPRTSTHTGAVAALTASVGSGGAGRINDGSAGRRNLYSRPRGPLFTPVKARFEMKVTNFDVLDSLQVEEGQTEHEATDSAPGHADEFFNRQVEEREEDDDDFFRHPIIHPSHLTTGRPLLTHPDAVGSPIPSTGPDLDFDSQGLAELKRRGIVRKRSGMFAKMLVKDEIEKERERELGKGGKAGMWMATSKELEHGGLRDLRGGGERSDEVEESKRVGGMAAAAETERDEAEEASRINMNKFESRRARQFQMLSKLRTVSSLSPPSKSP
ncbi:hypothetical protein HK102_000950 [Quaeritorhiza haematococci]|nr:hypothetical protein HK102_000950 [Quaeritorhiza haematococci]